MATTISPTPQYGTGAYQTIYGAPVPQAPTAQQLPQVGAPGSFVSGGTPQYSWTQQPGYTRVPNPYYNPKSGGQNANQFIYKYTGGGSTPGATGGTTTSNAVGAPTSGATSTAAAAPSGQSSIVQNPWNLAAQNSAISAGNEAGNQATANFGQADNMRTAANTGLNAGQAVLNTAFDPQQDLYNRTAQQLQDQVRVGEAARGITMSPYGAGLENSAMSNFNIDWQNNQLGRQVQGLGAYGTGMNASGNANTTAANLGQQGVGQTQAVGQMPWETSNQQQQTDIQNWIAYMNQANAATSGAMQNYPNLLAYQAMVNGGGVPYIPQSTNTFNLQGL